MFREEMKKTKWQMKIFLFDHLFLNELLISFRQFLENKNKILK
jgi:hypothetical protein